MAEYISKDRVKDFIHAANSVHGFTSYEDYVWILKAVIDTQAADVQPVKHGRWIDCTFYDPCEKSWEQDFEFECSNCGHKIYHKPNDDNLFCGHCGARMDLKDGDTDA